jgi:hypothetical protein
MLNFFLMPSTFEFGACANATCCNSSVGEIELEWRTLHKLRSLNVGRGGAGEFCVFDRDDFLFVATGAAS